jgi:multiple sugar transport system substrate-binding protein
MLRLSMKPGQFRVTAAAVIAVAALAAAGCGSSAPSSGGPAAAGHATSSSCKAGAVKLTFWAWAPGYNLVVNKFNKTHPGICVTMDDVGAANAEYTKLDAALKAGRGIPDVAEVEYIEVPSLEITHSLVNLVPYGIDKYKADIIPSSWAQVSRGSAVYAMPGDIGPLGFYYNSKELAKYHLTPPATWSQFASDAAALHKADPSAYLTNFAAADTEWLLSLMQQYGAFPFAYSGGSRVTVNFTGPQEMAFANYWEGLLKAHEVNSTPDFSVTSWNDMDNGTDASWLEAAWGPGYMAPNMKKTVGDWRAAPIPQRTAGAQVEGSWGGSTAAVIKGTAHPKQAAEFAEWFFGNLTSWKIHAGPVGQAFPGFTPLLDSASFKGSTIPLSGSSRPQVTFSAEAAHITSVQWPPFMEEVLTEGPSVFAGVVKGTETVPQAFKQFQNVITTYAKSQGFTVVK